MGFGGRIIFKSKETLGSICLLSHCSCLCISPIARLYHIARFSKVTGRTTAQRVKTGKEERKIGGAKKKKRASVLGEAMEKWGGRKREEMEEDRKDRKTGR